jgi:hypothetical protein
MKEVAFVRLKLVIMPSAPTPVAAGTGNGVSCSSHHNLNSLD